MDATEFPVDAIVAGVLNRLEAKPTDSWEDIYVWSDGSITGPEEPESEAGDLKLVSLFTPANHLPTAESIRESIEHGLATVDQA